MNAHERRGRSGYEHPDLVNGVVGRIELAKLLEWCLTEREKKGWGYPLVDRVLGNVD